MADALPLDQAVRQLQATAADLTLPSTRRDEAAMSLASLRAAGLFNPSSPPGAQAGDTITRAEYDQAVRDRDIKTLRLISSGQRKVIDV